MIRRHMIVHRRVQGVGFRYYCVHKARELGLTGWVKNLSDGTVELEAQGRGADIDLLLQDLDSRNRIEIHKIEACSLPLQKERGFYERW